MFHSEIQNNHKALAKEDNSYVSIPMIKQVDEEDIQENYLKIKREVFQLLKAELYKLQPEEKVGKNKVDASQNLSL